MSRTKDLLAQHPELVEDRLAHRDGHSEHQPAPVEDRSPLRVGHSVHLRVFRKDLVVSPVVTQGFLVAIPSMAVFLVAALAAAVFPVAIPLEVLLAGIPLVAVSPVVAEAAEAADKSQDKLLPLRRGSDDPLLFVFSYSDYLRM